MNKQERKQFSRREVLKLMGISAVGAAALSACAAPVTPTTGQPATAKTEITMWHGWTGADNTEMLTRMIDGYNKSNSDGITVVPTAYGWDDFFAKWVLAVASGNPADVALYHPTEMPEFVGRGTVIPIDELAEQVAWSWEGIADAVKQSCYYEGKLFGIIEDYHPIAMYYNVDLVKAAGLDPEKPPTTRDEFVAWATAMTKKDDAGNFTQAGAGVPTTGVARWHWHSYLYQNGATFLNGEGKAAFNTPQGLEAVEFMHDLLHKHQVAPLGQNDGQDFQAGKVGIVFNGPWNVNAWLAAKVPIKTAPLPACFQQSAAWANSHILSLSKTDSAERQLAGMKFIQWFALNNLEAAVNVGIIPVAPKVLEELKQHERWEYYKAFVDESGYLAYEPLVPQYSQIFSFGKPTPLTVNLEAALTDQKPMQQALDEMEVGINDILATPIS